MGTALSVRLPALSAGPRQPLKVYSSQHISTLDSSKCTCQKNFCPCKIWSSALHVSPRLAIESAGAHECHLCSLFTSIQHLLQWLICVISCRGLGAERALRRPCQRSLCARWKAAAGQRQLGCAGQGSGSSRAWDPAGAAAAAAAARSGGSRASLAPAAGGVPASSSSTAAKSGSRAWQAHQVAEREHCGACCGAGSRIVSGHWRSHNSHSACCRALKRCICT